MHTCLCAPTYTHMYRHTHAAKAVPETGMGYLGPWFCLDLLRGPGGSERSGGAVVFVCWASWFRRPGRGSPVQGGWAGGVKFPRPCPFPYSVSPPGLSFVLHIFSPPAPTPQALAGKAVVEFEVCFLPSYLPCSPCHHPVLCGML